MDVPEDVLWYIFCQNVPPPPSLDHDEDLDVSIQSSWLRDWPNGEHHQCMQTAKSTSQVCRRWRKVMMSSTDIWSKVIEFNTMSSFRKPNSWLQKVLKRAGHSRKFYVYGSVTTIRALQAFLELVRVVWDRIEVLSINISVRNCKIDALIHHVGWAKLTDQVSRSLRYFNLEVGEWLYDSEVQPRPLYLKSESPYLLFFRVQGMLQFVYQPQTQHGFESLRVLSITNTLQPHHYSLVIDDTNYDWDVRLFFDVLTNAPRLEILSISDDFLWSVDPDEYKHRPPLHLPHLRKLLVECDISACLAFLYHLELPSTCTLQMDVDLHYTVWPAEEVEAIQEIFWNRYGKPYSFVGCLSLRFTEYCPVIAWRPSWEGTLDQLYLSFNTLSDNRSHTSPNFPFIDFLLNDAFDFSNVTDLELDLDDSGELDKNSFQSLMDKFNRVRCLEMDWKSVDFLNPSTIQPPDEDTPPLNPEVLHGCPEILHELEEIKVLDSTAYTEDKDPSHWLRSMVAFCKLYSRRNAVVTESGVKLSSLKHLDMYHMLHKEEINYILPLLDELEGLTVSFGDVVAGKKIRKTEGCGGGRLLSVKVDTNGYPRGWSPDVPISD